MKKLLNTIKKFQLTNPVAIIIGSLIFSFHYVWINKYEFIAEVTGTESSFVVINKWTNRGCILETSETHRIGAHSRRNLPLCDSYEGDVSLP